MSTSSVRAALAALALVAGPGMLAGCAVPEVRGLVLMPGTRIALQQQPQVGFEVQVGETTKIPLPDHVNPRIDAVVAIGQHRLVLIEGALKSCAARPYLLVAKDAEASIRPLGKCDDRFSYAWTAEQFQARQVNARDPMIWTFRDGTLSGPVLQSALNRRGRAPALAAPADRPAEPATLDIAPPATLDVAPPATDPGRELAPAMPIVPPPVSRPVGDDVIPPPVGGGPLPQPAQRVPRLF